MELSLPSRRRALALGGSLLLSPWLCAAKSQFWDEKDPSQWTPEEIDIILSRSPWAKSVTASFLPNAVRGCAGAGGRAWNENPPPVPHATIGVGATKAKPVKSNFKGTVCWESAPAIRDARKAALPVFFDNHYVIRVSDFPAAGDLACAASTADERIDKLKDFATLEILSHAPVKAAMVQRPSDTVFLFGFPKFEITTAAARVDFSATLDNLTVTASFQPKEMLYRTQPGW